MAALEKVTKLQRSLALRLYRAILTAHRNLPPEMELIGNLYVREEFQRHKNAKPEHLKPFFEQWINCKSRAAPVGECVRPFCMGAVRPSRR